MDCMDNKICVTKEENELESPTRKEMIERLDFFIGTWTVEISHPHLEPNPITGTTVFEWMNDAYIVQRTHIDKSEFPSYTSIYDWDPATGQYVDHYFDSRGVTRLYAMSLEDGVWKLWRDKADFTPLDFYQRFTATIDDNKTQIDMNLEMSDDGVNWEHDFKQVFKKTV